MSWPFRQLNFNDMEITKLIGKTLVEIKVVRGNMSEDDSITFYCSDGSQFEMHHDKDCCESVEIDDIVGDINDLLNSPILKAEETSNNDNPKEYGYSHTWTFYHIATVKAHVTIRWYGESNGYYSEDVTFKQIK